MKKRLNIFPHIDCDSGETSFFGGFDAELVSDLNDEESSHKDVTGSPFGKVTEEHTQEKLIDKKTRKANQCNNPYEIAKRLVNCGNIFGVADKNLYYYDRDAGYYQPLSGESGEICIRKIAPVDIRGILSTRIVSEIIKNLKSYSELVRQITPYDNMLDDYINFKNGIMHVPTAKQLSHDPEYYFTNFIDVDYPFYDECYGENFRRYVKMVSGGDITIEKLLQEVLGLMIGEVRLKSAIFFYGKPNCGKTLLLNVMRKIIGDQFCSSISVHDLNDRYRAACLYGAKVNICGEVSEEKLKNLNEFKKATGNDKMLAEKKFDHPFEFVNKALMVFAGNNLPQIQALDVTNAYFNRIVIVPFMRSVPFEQQDQNLEQKLLQEKQYIVQYAVKGLQRLRKNNFQFTSCETANKIKADYISEQNSFQAFIEECCTFDCTEYTYSYKLKDEYTKFCAANDYQQLSHQHCHRMLKEAYGIQPKKNKAENRNGYQGIRINTLLSEMP